MRTINESEKNIPVILDCDVLVCGGGTAGCAAALAAARNGAKVVIIEKSYGLGGLATLGLIAYFLPLCDGNGHKIIGGMAEEFFHKSIAFGPGKIHPSWNENGDMAERSTHRLTCEFNPVWFQLELEKMILEEKITICYDTRLCAVKTENNKITAAIVESKSGRNAILCKAAIDATGDADLCFLSGEETVSLNSNRRAAWFYTDNGGKIILEKFGDSFLQPVPEGSRTFAGDSWEEVTAFCVDARNITRKEFLKMRGSSDKQDAIPVSIPSVPLMRKTRRLKGLYEINEVDENRYCETAVGMTGYYRKQGLILYFPYKCLIGKTENLFAAGRCISSREEWAWNITRGIPSCCITGQAAGTAAVLCTRKGVSAQNLDVKELQETLMSQGVIIDHSFAAEKG